MTREQAESMVDDLIESVHEAEIYNRRDYHKHKAEMRERVISALAKAPMQVDPA